MEKSGVLPALTRFLVEKSVENVEKGLFKGQFEVEKRRKLFNLCLCFKTVSYCNNAYVNSSGYMKTASPYALQPLKPVRQRAKPFLFLILIKGKKIPLIIYSFFSSRTV